MMTTDASTSPAQRQPEPQPEPQHERQTDLPDTLNRQPDHLAADRADGQTAHADHAETRRDADLAHYPEPVRAALVAIRELSRIAAPLHPSEWAQLNLTMGQLKTLMTLASQSGIGITQLAEMLAISKPTASTLVDQLVQAGYAQRIEDQVDRRRAIVTPTAEGDDLVLRLRQDRERLTYWLAQMDGDDLATLTRGLRALATIATRHDQQNGQQNGQQEASSTTTDHAETSHTGEAADHP